MRCEPVLHAWGEHRLATPPHGDVALVDSITSYPLGEQRFSGTQKLQGLAYVWRIDYIRSAA